MLYLGNFADIDTFEGNVATENEASLLGTYGSAGDPLYDHVVSVESDTATAYIDVDHVSSNGILTYDAGAGTVVTRLDSFVTFNGTVTYADGSSENLILDIVQTQNGDLFMPAWDTYTQFGTKAIESITLSSVDYDAWGGLTQASYDSVQFVCFATGTRIATPTGAVPVEDLAEGDLVRTRDDGPQPLLWIGRRALRFPPARESQKPIEFKPGSLGPDRPRRRLVVSPQHRVLLDPGPGRPGALAAAAALTGLPGIRRMKGCRRVTYHALLFARHQIIFAQGAPVESFYPGPQGLSTLGPMDRLRLLATLPGLRSHGPTGYGPRAHPVLSNRAARRLAASDLAQPELPR